jgi:hypothetical protein
MLGAHAFALRVNLYRVPRPQLERVRLRAGVAQPRHRRAVLLKKANFETLHDDDRLLNKACNQRQAISSYWGVNELNVGFSV